MGIVGTSRGFLPPVDPSRRLPASFDAWEEVASELPKLLAADRARDVLDAMPLLDTRSLAHGSELRRGMLLCSYFGHAWVWQGESPSDRLPPPIAVPWHGIAARLGRPPVLSYASYALDNWRRLDPERPIALGNLALLQNFLGGMDEDWFILVHVAIEAEAVPALEAMLEAQKAVANDEPEVLRERLLVVAEATESIVAVLERMPERCDPYVYYRRVRPFIHGWKNHPLLLEGVVYEGVEEWGGKGQFFRGETGAQSGIVPALDAVLGVGHADDPLRPYLEEMRSYMPPDHRAFLEQIESGPAVRPYVLARRGTQPDLLRAYDRGVDALAAFRSLHYEYADRYIHRQASSAAANPTDVGTGGTPFMAYLKKHRDETFAHRTAASDTGASAATRDDSPKAGST